MSQWKNEDSAANSVIWGVVGYNKVANAANRNAFFGNTTQDAYNTGVIVGQFGVAAAEAQSANGTVHSVVFTSFGSGYSANAVLTVAGGAGSTTTVSGNAQSFNTANGRIQQINFTNNGVNYTSAPTLTVAAPTASFFAGNATSVTIGTGAIDLGPANSALYFNGDRVTYTVAGSNTAIVGLANATTYSVVGKSGTTIKLSSDGTNAIIFTGVTATPQIGHSLTGQTATVVPVFSQGKQVDHAGWVVRKVGTGGRAGRVQYETLVAMGSITGDAADDTLFKDL